MGIWRERLRAKMASCRSLHELRVRADKAGLHVESMVLQFGRGLPSQDPEMRCENRCENCIQFFNRFRHNPNGECDCPKCQGICSCS